MDRGRKTFIIISGFLEALIFSGCLFGWPSLLLILQEEGIYRDLCSSDVVRHARNARNVNQSQSETIDTTNDDLRSQFNPTLFPFDFIISNTTSSEDSEFDDTEEILIGPIESLRNLGWEAVKNSSVPKCMGNDGGSECTRNLNETIMNERFMGCDEQRIHMTLIFTFAAVAYGITAVLIGLSLDKFGLRFTRLVGSTFACAGFIFLAYTRPENSYFLWAALNLIGIGTNQLRLSGYQFADLWPEYRATILTSYSSAYSISTTFFLVIQLMYEQNVAMRSMFLCCSVICAMTYVPTFFMPKTRIEIEDNEPSKGIMDTPITDETPVNAEEGTILCSSKRNSGSTSLCKMEQFILQENDELSLPQLQVNADDDDDNQNRIPNKTTEMYAEILGFNRDETKREKKDKLTVWSSLLCLSGTLHMYWHFINLFLILFYSSTFNIWASKVTNDISTVSFYIKMSGVCCLIAPLFVPVIGILTDSMIRRAERRPTRVERLAYTMQAPIFAMFGATLLLVSTMICKMFFKDIAIYASLILIAVSRPAVVGSCTSYIRLRFPAEQFNVLNGVFTTVISIMCFVQYPLMKWMTSTVQAYEDAHWLLSMLLIGSLISPIHMMSRKNIIHYAKVRLRQMID